MKKHSFVLFLLLFTTGLPGTGMSSELWKGMDLVKFCTGDTVLFDDATCRAYIQGITDSHEFYKLKGTHPKSFCVPEKKEARQKGESLVPKWFTAFKNRLHQKPVVLVVDAMIDIFPCPPKK